MRHPLLVCVLLCVAGAVPGQAVPQPLDDVSVARLQQELTPDPRAPWRSVPWQLDLLAAQRDAAGQHKPLFVWAMDGHPLGCT